MGILFEIEFTPDKYGEIEKVMHVITSEGWHVYKESQRKITNPNGVVTFESKIYFLRRQI